VRVVRAIVAPVISRRTYRRLAFLLLGAAAGFGFVSLSIILFWMLPLVAAGPGELLGLLAPLPLAAGVGLLRSTLYIQRAINRTLLGAPDVEMPLNSAITWRHRWRSAAFFVLHVIAGYLTGVYVIVAGAFAVVMTMNTVRNAGTGSSRAADPTLDWIGVPVVLLALLAIPYLAAGLGGVFTWLGARLLGITPNERLLELQGRVQHLAERNRLARELHDSVGHALSVVTIQAGAAQRTLEREPEVARAALTAIADSARRALGDLDHVLALLREEPLALRGEPAAAQPTSTLDHLDQLVTDLGAAGLRIAVERSGELAAVPAVVSREAYRIIQEGLTNALRHAGPAPVSLCVRAGTDALEVELDNPLPAFVTTAAGSRSRDSPHGLTGIRERVALLGGQVLAGPTTDPAGDRWRLWVRVPLAVP
jgi:signal transduction histidine kinase